MTITPVLQAKGLTKKYGRVVAIDGADFDLMPGEILAVIGDNGAGKSSLIRALSGAMKPDDGEILLDGKPISFSSPSKHGTPASKRSTRPSPSPPHCRSATTCFWDARFIARD